MAAGQGTDLYDVVCIFDDLFFVFDHHNGVAEVAQSLEYGHQVFGVFGVEAHTGFIEDVQRLGKVAAEGTGEVDALGFSARQGRRNAVEGQVAESHVHHGLQSAVDLGEDAFCEFGIVG